MIIRLPEHLLAVVESNDNLYRYLNNLLEGKPYTQRSWLYEHETSDHILEQWMSKLRSLESGNLYERNVYHFDTSQLEKWGPQGGVLPISDLLPLIKKGFGESSTPMADGLVSWERAKNAVKQRFNSLRLSLRPAAYDKVLDDMKARDTLESNSGWPLFTRRNKPEVKEQAINAAHNGDWKTYPAIALFRNYNNKTRLVWMYPMSVNVKEGSYLQPLQSTMINLLQKYEEEEGKKNYRISFLEYFSPWLGFQTVRKQIDYAYDNGYVLAASDFSATDEHFTKWHTKQVFDVIVDCFQPAYHQGLFESLMHMHEIPLVIGPKKMIIGTHGVSSGSNWTNFVETIFDMIFAEYVYLETNDMWTHKDRRQHGMNSIRRRTIIPWAGLSGIGDDMSWCTYDAYHVQKECETFKLILERLAKEVGHEANADKTNAQPDQVKFLQRLFQRGYKNTSGEVRAVYSTIRALKSSVFPEKMHKKKLWSSDMFCARQYMILENCVDHPLFEEFCLWVAHGQKDLIPFAHKDDQALDKIYRETKLIPGFNPTYNQEKRDLALSQFEAVKTVRKMT